MRMLYALCASALTSCASTPRPPESLLDAGRPPVVQVVAHGVEVGEGVADRIDPLMLGERAVDRYVTGDIWRAGFPAGARPGAPTLRLDATRLTWEVVALGFASKYSYSVSASLHVGGRVIPLRAAGYAHGAGFPHRPIREAVSMAVESIAQQVTAASR
jgi:hypothetical protein